MTSNASDASLADQVANVAVLQHGRTSLIDAVLQSIRERAHDLLRSEEQLIDELEVDRDMDHKLDFGKLVPAPIYRLLPELLSEVFKHAVRDLEYNCPWIIYVVRILCNVCATWRNVARATPFLWTSIDLEYFKHGDNRLLPLQLDLSGCLPLEVFTSARRGNSPVPCLTPFFAELSDSDAAHIGCIRIVDDGFFLSRLAARHLDGLRVADIRVVAEYFPHALNLLTHAPALRDLSVTLNYDCKFFDVSEGFPIPQFPVFPCLTRLFLCFYTHFPISAFIETLSKYAPSLCEIRTEASINADWEETRPTAICDMPAMRTAVLDMYTHKLLVYISAPVLESVTLWVDRFCDSDPTDSLLDLLTRSRPPLRTFSLMDPLLGNADTLERCLERMDGLRELRVTHIGYGETSSLRLAAMLRRLICEEDKEAVLPELRAFSLDFRDANASALNSEVKPLVSLVRRSRRVPRVCVGRAVVALEEFHSNVDMS